MNGWTDKAMVEKAAQVKRRGEAQVMIGTLSEGVFHELGAYDAGFEAGVLATENGLGRYDG